MLAEDDALASTAVVLPSSLLARAYRAGTEFAWPKEDALAVITVAEPNGHRTIGVDLRLATDPGPTIPTPFVYDWSPWQGGTARRLVDQFQWSSTDTSHAGRPPHFALTVVPAA